MDVGMSVRAFRCILVFDENPRHNFAFSILVHIQLYHLVRLRGNNEGLSEHLSFSPWVAVIQPVQWSPKSTDPENIFFLRRNFPLLQGSGSWAAENESPCCRCCQCTGQTPSESIALTLITALLKKSKIFCCITVGGTGESPGNRRNQWSFRDQISLQHARGIPLSNLGTDALPQSANKQCTSLKISCRFLWKFFAAFCCPAWIFLPWTCEQNNFHYGPRDNWRKTKNTCWNVFPFQSGLGTTGSGTPEHPHGRPDDITQPDAAPHSRALHAEIQGQCLMLIDFRLAFWNVAVSRFWLPETSGN